MKLITNERLIRRNSGIAKYASGAGLAVLLLGLLFSFGQPRAVAGQPAPTEMTIPLTTITLPSSTAVALSFGALILGFILTNAGVYFTNNWLRRPDQALNAALKGLDDRFLLVHYRLGASHALFAPAGVFVLVPKFQTGTVRYDDQKRKWHHKGSNAYFRLFGQQGLGNPSAEAAVEVDALTRALKKQLPGREIPAVQPIIVFTSDNVQLNTEGAPQPALLAAKLKDYLRRLPKGAALPVEVIKELEEMMNDER